MSIYLCGFRKGYSTQHALMRLVEKCREFLDKNGHAGALWIFLRHLIALIMIYLLLSSMHMALPEVHLSSLTAISMKENRGKWIIQCMEGINDRCSARFSLGTPFIQYIY